MCLFQTADKSHHVDDICRIIEECGGRVKLQSLQQDEKEQVYNASLYRLEQYFASDVSQSWQLNTSDDWLSGTDD